MKIDLHLHTKQTKKGDGISRNVSAENFKNQLKDAKVGLAAITNHNIFDEEQFKEFVDESYVLLPGIEIDFLYKDKRSQMNVIFSNKNIDSASNLSSFLEEKNTSSNNPIHFDELWNKIKDEEIIIFVDNKNSKTKVTSKFLDYISKKNKKNIPVLHDANNIRTHRILMSNKIDSFIGSDVQSWENNNYVENDSVDLIESQWLIKHFESFRSLLQLGKPVNEWLKKLDNKAFDCHIDKDLVKINILISGVNVIIGDKATGKTKILESIKEELNTNEFSYFSEDYKKEEYDKLMSSKDSIIESNKKVENSILEKMKEINDLKPEQNSSPLEFKENVLSPNLTNWKIQDSILDNNRIVEFDFISKSIKMLDDIEQYFKENNEKLFLNKAMIANFSFKIKEIRDSLSNIFIEKNIKEIMSNISDALKKGIRKIMLEVKGLNTNNLSLGLINLYNYQEEIKTKIDIIKNSKMAQQEKIILSFEVPTIGKLKLVDRNYLVPFRDIKKVKKHNSGKHKCTSLEYKESLKVFDNFSFENLENFKRYWNDENMKKGIIFAKREILNERGEKLELSSGQKSILLLANALKKDVSYILLDEPSSRIGSNTVMKYINERINELRRSKKTIVITTHNSSLGMNILPNKYIFRHKNENYETLWSYIYGDYFLDKDGNERKEFDFNKVVMDLLEGGKDSYKIRKDIYDSKINS